MLLIRNFANTNTVPEALYTSPRQRGEYCSCHRIFSPYFFRFCFVLCICVFVGSLVFVFASAAAGIAASAAAGVAAGAAAGVVAGAEAITATITATVGPCRQRGYRCPQSYYRQYRDDLSAGFQKPAPSKPVFRLLRHVTSPFELIRHSPDDPRLGPNTVPGALYTSCSSAG